MSLDFSIGFWYAYSQGVDYMTIEEKLKSLVLSRYASMREFSIALDMPYSTLDSIFKRGVDNASVANIIRICEALSISADELAAGKIVNRQPSSLTTDENELLSIFRSANSEGRTHILNTARLVAGNPAMQKERRSAPAM